MYGEGLISAFFMSYQIVFFVRADLAGQQTITIFLHVFYDYFLLFTFIYYFLCDSQFWFLFCKVVAK